MTTASGRDVTVLDLPCFRVQVPDTALGSDVAQILEQDPALPGVIVVHGREVVGLVARNQFFHRLGRRFGIEIYTPRPITAYLEQLPEPPIVVPEETTVQDAAIRCLARAPEYVYDPFIVTVNAGPPRLVDFLALILKQTDLLTAAQTHLEDEFADAATYVRNLLPPPLHGPPVSIDWCFHPSSHLGGDGFGYHWLEPELLAIYLLDVSGHGVGSALLASSVLNVLRTQSLTAVDFRQPSAVLEGLNRTFPMSGNDEKYFTIWYGVYHTATRALDFASGGHHAAILVPADAGAGVLHLRTDGPAVGIMAGLEYPCACAAVPAASTLYLFSDGVYELARPDGEFQTWEEFCHYLHDKRPTLGAVMRRAHDLRGGAEFEDDFSLLQIGIA
ncbi:MAG TPA: SpoIIE family protein phosphatase [Candidatus Methylacidiphilales bacterium]|jgi:hypothetical protein|nr:SpoIIE family protein phosphatase [Candidatus Methylacidiphilales bacterium]